MYIYAHIYWSRKWQPIPLFLPGKFHGQRSLVHYSPWGHRVGHDWAHMHTHGSTCLCIYIDMRVYVCIYVCVCIHTYMLVCILMCGQSCPTRWHIYIYNFLCVCVYIYPSSHLWKGIWIHFQLGSQNRWDYRKTSGVLKGHYVYFERIGQVD